MGKLIWRLVLIVTTTGCLFASAYYASKGDVAATVYMCFMAGWLKVALKEMGADGNG